MNKAENVKCSINRCTKESTVLVAVDRPRTTPTRDFYYSCSTGHWEAPYCGPHGVDRVSCAVDPDWRFFGDTITLRPLP